MRCGRNDGPAGGGLPAAWSKSAEIRIVGADGADGAFPGPESAAIHLFPLAFRDDLWENPGMTRREGLRLMATAAIGVLPGCGLGGKGPPPPSEESVYLLPGSAVDFLRQRARNGFACWQGGEKLAAAGPRKPFPVLSITKSVAVLAAARAISEGWLAVDETVDFAEWRNAGFPYRPTVRHLLNSTSGLKNGVRELYSNRPQDKGAAALRLAPEHPPGQVFSYGPASWELLAELLRRRQEARGTNFHRWFRGHLSAIGLPSGKWRLDGRKMPYFSTGMECTVEHLHNLGGCLCHLLRGQDHAGLSAAAYLGLCAPRAANPMFSAGAWWNREAGRFHARPVEPEEAIKRERRPDFWQGACLQPGAHPGWVALVGSSGSRVYLLPSASAIVGVARGGKNWSDSAMIAALSRKAG